jgi:hypothetical protein
VAGSETFGSQGAVVFVTPAIAQAAAQPESHAPEMVTVITRFVCWAAAYAHQHSMLPRYPPVLEVYPRPERLANVRPEAETELTVRAVVIVSVATKTKMIRFVPVVEMVRVVDVVAPLSVVRSVGLLASTERVIYGLGPNRRIGKFVVTKDARVG